MEAIIYVAVSANGQILLTNPDKSDSYQTPIEVLQDCIGLAHQIGNMVIGLNTYNLFFSNPNAKDAFIGVEIVVLSADKKEKIDGVTFLNTIEAVMEFYKTKGYSKIFVAGGAYTYQSFINNGYMNEIYLNYMPLLTVSGVQLLTDTTINKTFTLIESKLISEDIIQLHYKTNL
jgi:dihydrofolate reductase